MVLWLETLPQMAVVAREGSEHDQSLCLSLLPHSWTSHDMAHLHILGSGCYYFVYRLADQTHYEVLQIPRSATAEQIKNAYIKRCKQV